MSEIPEDEKMKCGDCIYLIGELNEIEELPLFLPTCVLGREPEYLIQKHSSDDACGAFRPRKKEP